LFDLISGGITFEEWIIMKGKFLTLIGTALTLAFSSTVAVAQSTKFPEGDFSNPEKNTEISESDDSLVAAADEKISPEAMEILCQRFPLNSRCDGTNEPTASPEDTTTEEAIPSENEISPENNIDTTPEAPLPDSSGEGVTPIPGTAPEGEFTLPSEDDAPTNITPMPGSAPEGEVTPSIEGDAPTNITPMPGSAPEGEVTPSTEGDAPTNITPMPGSAPEGDSPSNINKPEETTVPDSDSSKNTEQETTEGTESGVKILTPQ